MKLSKWLLLFLFVCALGILAQCFNPFVPPTGVDTTVKRGTPDIVLKQLMNSYETRRLNLFKDLFGPDESQKLFRYYVAQDIISDGDFNNLRNASVEYVDLNVPFIDNGFYRSLTITNELEIHKKLFAVDNITFRESLESDSVAYVLSAQGDTVAAAVRTRKAQILITADFLTQTMGSKTLTFDIEKQIFYMERDPHDATKWIITKWFELRGW